MSKLSMHEKMTGKGKVIEKNPIYNAWESVKDGAPDGKYERVITPHFSADSDDIFMRSMLTKYARNKYGIMSGKGKDKEGAPTKKGEPTGKFTMTEAQAKAAATEVLGTHKGLTGAAADAYLGTYWAKSWGHFDVNRTGKITVYRMPELMRFLCSDQYMSLGQSGRGKAKPENKGPLDKKYERPPPEHFATGTDDLFMKSMIMNYAQEGKDKDGAPNGQFFMTEAQTKAAAAEVLGSHKELDGPAKAEYLKTYFPRTWAHFDVNKQGMIGVECMPQFMRFLASDQTLNLQSGKGNVDNAKYFPRTWAHFDVNKDGRIGVEAMPQFMRFLAGGKGQAGDNHFAASGKDKLASAVDRLIELYELRLAMMLS